MDVKQMLPLLLKGKLDERQQAIIRATQSADPAAITTLLTQMYAEGSTQSESFSILKRIIPAKTLGTILKYFETNKRN